jgi:hypothetical protein
MKNVKKFLKRKIKLVNRVLSMLIFVAFLACLYFLGFPWIKQTVASATTMRQDTFTELYFENHTLLPKLVDPGKHYSFTFTIHNSTQNENEYSYAVYYYFNGVKYFLDNKTFSLKANGYKSVKEIFVPTVNLPRVKIIVELLPSHQQIAFWTQLY